jgi:spermidine synthase
MQSIDEPTSVGRGVAENLPIIDQPENHPPVDPGNVPRQGERLALRIGCIFFFTSGAAALMYEVVWLRLLGLVFGNTTYAISTVLATYMAGLGVGSYFLGRYADRWMRPLRAYGILEIGIGTYAAFTFPILYGIQFLYVSFAQTFSQTVAESPGIYTLIRLALCVLILFVPTFFMGATLPILARFYIRRKDTIGSGTALLYGLNTIGAVTGTVLTGFWLLPLIGLRGTLTVAVVVNVVVGGLAIWLSSRTQPMPATEPEPEIAVSTELAGTARASGGRAGWLLPALVMSGATTMAYEVSWTRTLSTVCGSSTYAFTIMLATFLFGLAIGAAVFQRLLTRRVAHPADWGWMQLTVALAALIALPLFQYVDVVTLRLFAMTVEYHGLLSLMRFLVCGALMLIPAFCFGALFPVSVSLYTRDPRRISQGVGRLYLYNSFGNIIGSLAAGFILIRLFGIHTTMLITIVVSGVIGLWAVLMDRRRTVWRLTPVALVALVLIFGVNANRSGWDSRLITAGLHIRPFQSLSMTIPEILSSIYGRDTKFYAEGMASIVNVDQHGGHRNLKVNGKTDASTGLDMRTQVLSGHLPMLIHPGKVERAMVIGFGSGTTLGAVLAHEDLQTAHQAEIEQSVLDAAPYFDRVNRRAYQDKKATIFLNDGRNHLLVHRQPYDIIISEPSNPWMAGVSYLFTEQFYELACDRLEDDGVFCQWLQRYSISPEDFQMVIASVQSVFPHVQLWKTMSADTMIIASKQPLTFNTSLINERIAKWDLVRQDLAEFEIHGAAGLLYFFEMGEADVKTYTEGASLNTDDTLLLGFNAPKWLYQQGTTELITELLVAHRTTDYPRILPADFDLDTNPEAMAQLAFSYLGTGASADRQKAADLLVKAIKIDPENAWFYYGLGRAFSANSNWAKAKTFMEKAMLLDPTSARYNAYSSLVLAKIDILKYSEISLERLGFAIEKEPDNPDYYYWQAQIFEALDRHNQAQLAFKRAAAHDVWNLNYKLGQARNLRLAGARNPEKIEAAIEVIEEGVRRDASGRRDNINYYPAYKELRTAYLELESKSGDGENLAKAIALFEELVNHNPYKYQYWIDLIHLYDRAGDYDRAQWAIRQGKKTQRYFTDILALTRDEKQPVAQ